MHRQTTLERVLRTPLSQNDQRAFGRFPPSAIVDLRVSSTGNNGSWGVQHTGFTVARAPNSNVAFTSGGQTHGQMHFNSWQEGKDASAGNPTCAMITSRSHQVGLVQVALVDGSVTSITESIDLETRHALGTRNGHEVVAVPQSMCQGKSSDS